VRQWCDRGWRWPSRRSAISRAAPNWAGAGDHAIEMAVSRPRRSLHETDLIQTVVKRGYRLAP
jgi:DNA-binding response OmpR family regulator